MNLEIPIVRDVVETVWIADQLPSFAIVGWSLQNIKNSSFREQANAEIVAHIVDRGLDLVDSVCGSADNHGFYYIRCTGL